MAFSKCPLLNASTATLASRPSRTSRPCLHVPPAFTYPLRPVCSMTSATKFIGGHSDVTAGILAVRGSELADRIYFVQV